MRTIRSGVILLFILCLAAGCSSRSSKTSDENTFITFNNELSKQVNLYTSLNYRIVADPARINQLFHEKGIDQHYAFEVIFKVTNKGTQKAHDIKLDVIEPIPILPTRSSTDSGLQGEPLSQGKEVTLYGIYSFDTEDKMNQFIEEAKFTCTWTESSRKRTQTFRLAQTS